MTLVDHIEINDLVDVTFTRNNIFEWQESPTIADCIVTKTPSATGDTFGFRTIDEINEMTRDFFINPNCSEFVGIEFIRKIVKNSL